MPRVLQISAVKNADDIVNFSVFDTGGNPIDLDAEGATAVKIEICGSLHNSIINAESFSGNSVSVKFGKLSVPASKNPYNPKVYYITDTEPNGVTLAACGFETSIKLKMVC